MYQVRDIITDEIITAGTNLRNVQREITAMTVVTRADGKELNKAERIIIEGYRRPVKVNGATIK